MSIYKVNMSAAHVVPTATTEDIPFDNLKISTAGEFNTTTYQLVPLDSSNPVTFLVLVEIEFASGEAWLATEQAKLILNWNDQDLIEKTHTIQSGHSNAMGMSIHTLVTVPYPSFLKAQVWHNSAVSHTISVDDNLTQFCMSSQQA